MRWRNTGHTIRIGMLAILAGLVSAQHALPVEERNGCEHCTVRIIREATLPVGSQHGAVDIMPIAGEVTAHQPSLPRPKVTDSLGIRVVEYDLMPPPSPTTSRFVDPFSFSLRGVADAFIVSREPFVLIGGQRSNADEELDAAQPFLSSILLGNGTIVVNDLTQLKYFRSDGTLIRAVGRRGNGPMEFTQTREMCRLRGDSILVFDYNGRLSLWDAAGRFAHAFARPPGRRVPGSCDEFGNFVAQDAVAHRNQGATDDVDALFATRLIRPDGSVVRDLGLLPGPESRGLIGRVPSIIPLRESLLVCGARNYELLWRNTAGKPRQIARLGRRPLGISEEESRARVARSVPSNITSAEGEVLRNNLSSRGFAKFWPAYSSVRVDVAGRVWVADYESEAAWTVFDSSGTLVGRVELNKGRPLTRVRLLEVGRDFVAIAEPDADGAVQIRYHRIVGSGARRAEDRGATGRPVVGHNSER